MTKITVIYQIFLLNHSFNFMIIKYNEKINKDEIK